MFYRKIYLDFVRQKVFMNGNFLLQRNLVTNLRENIHRDIIQLTIENAKLTSLNDWTNVKKAILEHEFNRGRFTTHNIDAVIMGHCINSKRLDLGVSYIDFLSQENIKPNLATVGKFLQLIYLRNYKDCLDSGKTCKVSEEKLILKYYGDLRRDYPVLDSFSLTNVVLALSLTSKWKECLDLLKEIKVSTVPSIPAYSAVIAASFLHNEETLGWQFLEEMLGYERIPTSVTYLAYIKSLTKIKKKGDAVEKLEKLFLFFQEKDLKCDQDVAVTISQLGEKLGYKSDFTTVSYRGVCKSCSKNLDNFELSQGDFNELKNKVFENVIVGRDVFIKTTPEEVERFKKFVVNMGRFDVVLDGLNVAYASGTKKSPRVFSALVASVVSYFVQRRKKVLVLGRVHMDRWNESSWAYVRQNASVFLAHNISQDDPYLLYCALSSGKDTVIVTRDLMRSHRFLLKDPKLKTLFNRWLSQRQWQLVRVDDRNGPVFRIPPPFSILTQRNGETWHLPYDVEMSKDKNDFHRTWLCLKK